MLKAVVIACVTVSGLFACEAFSIQTNSSTRFRLAPLSVGNPFESQHNQSHDDSTSQNTIEDHNHPGGDSTFKANRWSKHAPDANLPTDEFKNQLKENMKGDLESRRASLPNRGNQPAKHYLDSL